MATREIILGNGRSVYCKNGDKIEQGWKDWVGSGGKDSVVCCQIDPDYQKGKEVCFKMSDISGTRTPSSRGEDETSPPTIASGPITINMLSHVDGGPA